MTEWINVADITPRIGYTATASQTAFTVPFVFFENSDLLVYQNTVLLTLDTHYSVTGAEAEAGGTVTLLSGAATGDTILISRRVPIEQTTHIPPSGPLDVGGINVQFSKLIAIAQQLDSDSDRNLHLQDSDSTVSIELESVANRKNKLLGFGSSGELIYPLGPTFVGTTSTGVALVDSRATAQVTVFAVSVNVVWTEGIAAPGDSEPQAYIRGIVSDPGAFQDAGAVYWKPVTLGVATAESRAAAALKKYPSTISVIETHGLATPGDGGDAVYVRGAGSGAFTDAAGVTWIRDTSTFNPAGQVPAAVPTTSNFTVTIASPGVFTWAAHGLSPNAPMTLSTTGALPTGLAAATFYYVIGSSITNNTFKLATSLANARAGTAINTSGSQSGTHTALANILAPGMKGYIYEGERLIGSPIAVLNQTVTEVCATPTLAVGSYDLTGEAIMTSGATVWATEYHIVVTTTVAPTLTGLPNKGGGAGDHQTWATAQGSVFPVGPMRLVVTTPIVARLNVYSTFGTNGINGGGNLNSFGYIRAELR